MASEVPTSGYFAPRGVLPEEPSLGVTVFVTFFFGLLGAIPAYVHGKQAAQRGGSPSRYWAAFGGTLVVWLLWWALLVVLFLLPYWDVAEVGPVG
jgi:drug/metabolite transporter superfamily protein YnfA